MDIAKVNATLAKYERDPDFLIEILQDVQDQWRYLPEDVMKYVGDELRIPLARVTHIATFYSAFSLEPRGEHEVQVCMGTACHVKGAPRVLDALARELSIEPGETTPDGKFSLDAVRCVGCCGLAPAVVVGDDVHSEISADKADKIVAAYTDRQGR